MLKWIDQCDLDKEHVYRDHIKVGNTGRFVVVDSRQTMDAGYETMVFEARENGEVLDWEDLDLGRYDTWQEMKKGHDQIVEKWKKRKVAEMNQLRKLKVLDNSLSIGPKKWYRQMRSA